MARPHEIEPDEIEPHKIELGLAERVCSALVCDGVNHGWAIGGLLAHDGELGRIWSLSRPLTYRAIEQLADKGMITRTGTAPGRGRDRRTIAPTAAGQRANRTWLDQPVEHLRDVRTELLLKLELRSRAGEALAPLLEAQRSALMPVVDTLTTVDDPDLVDLWRRESARSVRRFLDAAIARAADDPSRPGGVRRAVPGLRLSARNQLVATIAAVDFGEQLCTVRAVVEPEQTITATVTREAVEELDLTEGDAVVMVSKASETLVAR